MKSKVLYFFILAGFIAFFSCNQIPKSTKEVLSEMEQKNRNKFELVLKHFEKPEDSLKYKVACFLIENMDESGYYEGNQLEDYNTIFDILAHKPSNYWKDIPWYSTEIGLLFDSLKNIYGPLDLKNLQYIKDKDTITVEFMINYINDAFLAWNNPWSKNTVSFSDFCNYVLPYRNFNETLEPWRQLIKKRYDWIYNVVNANDDIIEVARKLNIGSELRYSDGFANYPVTIAPSLLLKAKYGSCTNTSNFKSLIMRTYGIPATIDFLPQYGADHNQHYWNSIMDKNGNFVSFEEALNDSNASVAYKYKIGKVFRRTFTKNKDIQKLIQDTKGDLPATFKDPNFIDVTSQYVAVTNVKLKLNNIPSKGQYIYLGVFNDVSWTPIDYAKVNKNKFATFQNLGRDVMYLPIYFIDGNIIPAGSPFKITLKGYIQYMEPQGEVDSLSLTRKYHMFPYKTNRIRSLVNAQFQGANKADFSDAVTLATIHKMPGEHFEELKSNNYKEFKYLRLVFSPKELNIDYIDGDGACIAEIQFLDPVGRLIKGKVFGSPGRKFNPYKVQNCFDGNPLTFFQDSRPDAINKFAALELGKAQKVYKIRYLARNDMNSIQRGNMYELFYWSDNKFISLGRMIAQDTMLRYNNVPKNSLLLLKNLTEGHEERIFTWENNKQVMW